MPPQHAGYAGYSGAFVSMAAFGVALRHHHHLQKLLPRAYRSDEDTNTDKGKPDSSTRVNVVVGAYALLLLFGHRFFFVIRDAAGYPTNSSITFISILVFILSVIMAGQCWLSFAPTRYSTEIVQVIFDRSLAHDSPVFLTAFRVRQARLIDVRRNFQTHTVRSVIELASFIGVSYMTSVLYHDVIFALKCGTCGGILVVLLGEVAVSSPRFVLLDCSNNFRGIYIANSIFDRGT